MKKNILWMNSLIGIYIYFDSLQSIASWTVKTIQLFKSRKNGPAAFLVFETQQNRVPPPNWYTTKWDGASEMQPVSNS
jgi:hypothetical protein